MSLGPVACMWLVCDSIGIECSLRRSDSHTSSSLRRGPSRDSHWPSNTGPALVQLDSFQQLDWVAVLVQRDSDAAAAKTYPSLPPPTPAADCTLSLSAAARMPPAREPARVPASLAASR